MREYHMINEDQAREVVGSTAYTNDGEKLGKVGHLFLDDQTGRPEFVSVNTGLFGTNETFIPIADGTFNGDRLTVPYTKAKVKDAPNVDVDAGHLDESEERRLYEYYGVGDASYYDNRTETTTTTGVAGVAGDVNAHGTEGHDTSGPTTDDAMTRSEERLDVGKTRQETGRARLRKYVTTEQETVTVPVQKERAVLETEPITEGNVGNATGGPAISEEEHEVVLSEEQVQVSKTAEPVERVRLGTETVTQEETVTEEVRKEHIEAEGDVNDRR
jgi:uncharacterized protein (TIGR02271 family)